MHIGIVGSFPPSVSGIAEFSEHFETSLRTVDPSVTLSRIIIVDDDKNPDRDVRKPLAIIHKEQLQEYLDAATAINESPINLLVIQHEFSSYGGGSENTYIQKLIQHVTKPIILVAHTVPVDSDAHYTEERELFFKSIKSHIAKIFTFLPKAKETLVDYGYPNDTICVFPHPVPHISQTLETHILRTQLHLKQDAFIALSFGFFHPNKGTATTIEAIKICKQQKEPVVFVYAGTTLPTTTSQAYFKKLRETIDQEHLEDMVVFDLDFVSQTKLFSYIQAADIGIVPYIYRSYTASGPLSFFIGAGKPIITTPFAYATSVLNEQNACFVPFENGEAIATAITKFRLDTTYRTTITDNCTHLATTLTWDVIGKKYMEIFHTILASTTSVSGTIEK